MCSKDNVSFFLFQLAAILFLACSACALPQYYYRQGYGSYGLGDPYQPQSLRSFRYAQNPIRNQQYQTQNQRYQPQQQSFGRSIGTQNNNNNFGNYINILETVVNNLRLGLIFAIIKKSVIYALLL